MKNTYGFATRQVHAGHVPNDQGALTSPIYQTSTFSFSTVEQGGARFAGAEQGYIYTRLGNPTQQELEGKMASLEEGEAALACASGLGAISSALWTSLQQGDEIIASDTLYGCTYALLQHGISKFGIIVHFVDLKKPDAMRPYLNEKTKVVYFETPCNPTLKIIDIEAVSDIAHQYNKDITVIVDNTFCSPYVQKPLTLGADVVVHSATKYLNGHGDVIAGIIVGKQDFITRCRFEGLKDMTGSVISPFNAFLLLRGLKTLDIRMNRHCANALEVANYFKKQPLIRNIYYPGFPEFDNHEVAKHQMQLYGGMIAIELNANKEKTAECLNQLKLVKIAVSLGDCETLVEHPATMTHSTYSKEELAEAGISEGLVRISIGLEDPVDIIADFEQAFASML